MVTEETKVAYQIGVDILGFPVYMVHTIPADKIVGFADFGIEDSVKTFTLYGTNIVRSEIIKQH
jgi:hypothetical protein